ncbi:MAG: hypothetical protein GF388_07695 [Candidatus Aegiribacteria sp.]|nr:hypothetical protein [Candidatus Aegiribacteria sp.]MBD3295002.1 hypothetical protein [Candidatus Fermentibacteria bacterium]
MKTIWILVFIAFGTCSGSLEVVISGSPPVPDFYQFGIDQVTPTDSSISILQQTLLQWYLRRGYPFASAGFYFPAGDTLKISAVPGRHALLEEVRIEGMPGTDPKVFSRLLSLEPGQLYSMEAVERWKDRLERLEFVRSAGATELYLGTGGDLVLVQFLEKGSPGHFSASMDWKGENLEGMGEILFLNLAGTARQLEISGRTTEWGGLNAYLRYREPWIMGVPLSIELEASQNTPESSWVNRELSLRGILSTESTDISAGGGVWRGYPPDGSRQNYDYGLAGIEYTSRTSVPQGWKGFRVSLEARSGNRSSGDSSGVLTMTGLEFRGDTYTGLLGFGGDVLAGGVMQGDWFSGLLQQLGGQETIRGYPEYSFRAVRYLVGRPEISLGETETRIYVFWDAAVVETAEQGMRYPSGLGAGIRGRSGRFNADAAAGFPVGEGLGSSRLYLKVTASL